MITVQDKILPNYSETSCSFARHFAILSRNVSILIGSLLRASCDSNFNLLPEQMVFHIGICYVHNSDLASFSRPRFRQKNGP